MKKIMALILFPILILVVLFKFDALSIHQDEKIAMHIEEASLNPGNADTERFYKDEEAVKNKRPVIKKRSVKSKRDRIVNYAMTLLGSPYAFAGNTKNGFDCSGFTTHVFSENDVPIKRSSVLQSSEGKEVDRSEAAPGDLIIFTGTNETVREPGHVGIVISEPGDTIEFIHASSSRSDGGVKISQVEGSGYETRFLGVRRVL